MTIGERLEEARKRKGISIREVADATKIRSEYLASMEDNSMEIPLPEIYRRGFLRNYANFLKLDADKVLTDYEAQFRGSSTLHRERSSASEDRPVFGRMEIQADEASSRRPQQTPDREEEPSSAPRQEPPARPTAILTDNTLYLKIAAGLAGTALVVLLVFLLVWLLRSGDSTTDVAQPATDAQTSGVSTPDALSIPSDPTTIILRASGGDVTVIVDNVVTRERLFSGVLSEGNVQQIEKDGPLLIKYSSGNDLSIEYTNGLSVPDLRVGMGQLNLP